MVMTRAGLRMGSERAGVMDSTVVDLSNPQNSVGSQEAEAELQAVEKREKDAPRIEAILDKFRSEKAAILGPDALMKRRELVRRRREDSASLVGRELAESRMETRRQANAHIQQVDLEKLGRLRREVGQELHTLVRGSDTLPQAEFLEDDQVPEDIRGLRHNFTAVPPYPYNWRTFSHGYDSGTSELTNIWLDRSTGRVGERMAYFNGDADNADWCDQSATSLIGFQVPNFLQAKKWKFSILLHCDVARAQFHWTDEWGFSFTWNDMQSNLRIAISTEPTVNLLYHPFERRALWPPQHWQGDDDMYRLDTIFPTGFEKWVQWTTDFVLPNAPATVDVGVADYTSYWTDDVSLSNIMNNRWFIKAVSIELVS